MHFLCIWVGRYLMYDVFIVLFRFLIIIAIIGYNLIFLNFFEVRYKTVISRLVNVLILIAVSISSLLFKTGFPWNHVFSWVLMYLYLFFVFRVYREKAVLINFILLLQAIFILFSVYFLVQFLVPRAMEETCFSTCITLVGSVLLFFILYKYIIRQVDFAVYHRLNYSDLIFFMSFFIFSLILFIGLFFLSHLYDLITIEFFVLLLSLFMLTFLLFFIRLFYKLCDCYKTENELLNLQKKEELTYEYYKRIEKVQSDMSYLLHDIKNYLINQEIEEKKISSIYSNNLHMQVKDMEPSFYSSLPILQMLFSDKIEEGKKIQIDLKIHNEDKDMDRFDEYDLITIFSNLINLAFNEIGSKSGEQSVDLFNKEIQGMLVIKEVFPIIKETKQIKLMNKSYRHMQKVINKYQGVIEFNNIDNHCQIILVFPLPPM